MIEWMGAHNVVAAHAPMFSSPAFLFHISKFTYSFIYSYINIIIITTPFVLFSYMQLISKKHSYSKERVEWNSTKIHSTEKYKYIERERYCIRWNIVELLCFAGRIAVGGESEIEHTVAYLFIELNWIRVY